MRGPYNRSEGRAGNTSEKSIHVIEMQSSPRGSGKGLDAVHFLMGFQAMPRLCGPPMHFESMGWRSLPSEPLGEEGL